jgi:nucleoside-diphosphate-sugar epimerase
MMHINKNTHTKISSSILNSYQGRTILITGGRGYIGSALSQFLANVDCKLILLDQSSGDTWRPDGKLADVQLLNGNASERMTWESVLPGVDYVFHLAAREYFYRSDYKPELDYKFNALPALHLLEVCRTHNYQPKIIFASSANLFGLVYALPVNEDNRDNPLTMWAVHKLAAEHYLRLYDQKFAIKSLTLRLANVYGPTACWSVMGRVVINKMIARALDVGELITYTNQCCIRDFVFLEDVVQAFLLAGVYCGSTESLMFVIGSGDGKTITDTWHLIADNVRSHVCKNVPIRLDESVEIEPLEMRNFVADTKRFQDATGWKPQIGLTQGIDITVRSILSKLVRSS